MKGDCSSFYKIGFSGMADVLKVDIDHKWMVKFADGYNIIKKVEVDVNEYGCCTISGVFMKMEDLTLVKIDEDKQDYWFEFNGKTQEELNKLYGQTGFLYCI